MKRNKLHGSALLMALLLLFSLTSCGSSGSYSAGTGDSYYATESAVASEADYGYYDGAEYEYDESAALNADAGSSKSTADAQQAQDAAAKPDVKIIYTANLNVEALDLDVAVDALNKLVDEMGGYFQSSDRGTSGRSRYANYTVRVPSAKYRAFLDAWSDSENCKITSSHEDTEDVGVRYFDLETHLTTLRNKMNRLQALLEQATEMEDIIQLESAISETEYEIELYTSDLNRYDSLINYSTVNLSLREVVQLVEEEEVTFLQRLGQNFRWGLKDFGEGLQDFAVWAAYNFIGIIIFLVVLVLFLRWFRKWRRERREHPKESKWVLKKRAEYIPPVIGRAKPEDARPEAPKPEEPKDENK